MISKIEMFRVDVHIWDVVPIPWRGILNYSGVRECLLATLALPRAPVKAPCRKSDENVGSLTAFWHPLGVPLGTISGTFCVLFDTFSVHFFEASFEGFRSLRGPTPTVKTMVSFTRNHRFHISTWSSKIIENCL